MFEELIKKSLSKGNKLAILAYESSSKGKREFDEFKSEASKYTSFQSCLGGGVDYRVIFHEYIRIKYEVGASIEDYFLYEFYRKSDREIDTYVTERRRSELYRYADDIDSLHIFGNKEDFYKRFSQYMQKNCIFVADEKDKKCFMDFCMKNKNIVIKPAYGQRGIGVQRLTISDKDEIEKIWNGMLSKKTLYEVDKVILNCQEIERFHPQSLNTIRLSIVLDILGAPHIMAATLRTGSGDNQVDNGHHEGIYAAIDVNNGVISSMGFNNSGEVFLQHPDTGILFPGTQIPYWGELISLAQEIAVVEPSMRYIGWDFALDDSYNWVLLEGNEPGAIDIHQQPLGKGLYYEYSVYIYGN